MNVSAPLKTWKNAMFAKGGKGIDSARDFIVAHLRVEHTMESE